jgi:hypothetical protein
MFSIGANPHVCFPRVNRRVRVPHNWPLQHRTVWFTGTGIGLVATFFWANYLAAPADQELALMGPLGG